MHLSDLKRLQYELVSVLHDVVNDKLASKGRASIEKVIGELKTMDEHTNGTAQKFEAVTEEEVKWHVKALKQLNNPWSLKCAETMDRMWRNLKQVDKKLHRKGKDGNNI